MIVIIMPPIILNPDHVPDSIGPYILDHYTVKYVLRHTNWLDGKHNLHAGVAYVLLLPILSFCSCAYSFISCAYVDILCDNLYPNPKNIESNFSFQ